MKSLIKRREAWLKKEKISIGYFASAVGVCFSTAYLWVTTGRRPRELYLKAILKAFPTWPN